MRRILVDHARKMASAKRGKGYERLPLDVSPRTVRRDGKLARAWLSRELEA